MLMAWFSGESEKGLELTVLGLRGRRQPDGAMAWDRPVSEFFRCADRNMHGSQLWNNAVRRANGFKEPFTLYHINGIGTDGRWAKLAMSFRASTNNGATWSQPVIMKQNVDADHLSADRNQPQGDVIVTSDGEFLSFSDGAARNGTGASLNFSSDGGRTWSVRGLHGPPGVHVGCAWLEDGSVLAFSRDKGANFGSLPQSISTDKGLTWNSSGSEFPPVGTIQRLVLLRLAHSHPAFDPENQGRRPLLLISFADNGMAGVDATGKPATIYGTYAALSWNGGKTWPIKRVLSNVKTGNQEFVMGPWSKTFELDATHGQPQAYWAACQTPDGMIHLTDSRLYYGFNLAWLANGSKAGAATNGARK
jgi:formylglycine-generating enzyme